MNIHILYEISRNCSISSYPTLENCLFGAVSLTKNILDMVLDLIGMENLVLAKDLVKTV